MPKRARGGMLRRAVLALKWLTLIVIPIGAPVGSTAKPYTIEDVLAVEGVGHAAFRPGTKTLFFERIRSIGEYPAKGFYFGPQRRALIYVASEHDASTARPLFDQSDGAAYFLGPFSPSGARLLIYRLQEGELQIGSYDVGASQARFFDFTPGTRDLQVWGGAHRVWLSEKEFVTTAFPTGQARGLGLGPAATANRLISLWRTAWRNDQPTATALSSGSILDAELRANPPAGSLLLVNAESGAIRVIGLGRYESLLLSPNGRYLAALRNRGPWRDLSEPDAPLGSFNPHRLLRRRLEVVVFDLARKGTRPIFECGACGADLQSLHWSSDSQFLHYVAASAERADSAASPHKLDVLRRADSAVELKNLNLELASTESSWLPGFKIGYTIWGNDPVVYAHRLDLSNLPERADWFLLKNGKAVNLTSQFEQVPKIAPKVMGSEARFRTEDGDYIVDRFGRLLMTAPPATAATQLTESASSGDAAVSSKEILAVSDDGKAKAVDMQTPAGGALLIYKEDGAERKVWTYNEHLALIRQPSRVLIRYKSATGRELNSWLILPPGHKDGERHPTLVFGYPNLKVYDDWPASNPGFLDPWNATFLNALPYVERGYAFLLVDVDITPLGARADRLSEIPGVVLPAIDRAIEEGYVDPDKIGLYGGSQNGYVQTSLLCQSDRFKAAVSFGSTLQDLISAYGVIGRKHDGLQEYPSLVYYGQPEGMLLAAPWQHPEGYARNSPLMCADKINTPILLMRGDLDSWSGGQSEELFVALYRMNKDAELITYWGEGHGLRSPANIRDFNRRVLEWYERYMPTSEMLNSAAVQGALTTVRLYKDE